MESERTRVGRQHLSGHKIFWNNSNLLRANRDSACIQSDINTLKNNLKKSLQTPGKKDFITKCFLAKVQLAASLKN